MSCSCSCSRPACGDAPQPYRNTARASGRYACAGGCSGELSAVSAAAVTQVVDVSVDKTVRPACVCAGGSVHYTITVCNRSSAPAACVRVTDPCVEDLLDVGTIYLNGQPLCGASLREGVRIPGIAAGCCAAVTFDAAVPAGTAGTVANTAYADFEFSASVCPGLTRRAASNEAVLTVAAPALEISKQAAPCAVTPEDNVITYTLNVCNTGTCPVEDVRAADELPEGLTYVCGSTTVGGGAAQDLDPADGICLGSLAAGQCVAVTFQARAEV